MKLTIITNSMAHQQEFAVLLEQGVRSFGDEPHIQTLADPIPTRDVACWGWKVGKRLRAGGHNVLVMERGYIGDRFEWTSMAWNGLNGYGKFYLPSVISSDRFDHNFRMYDWENRPGGYALLIGQVSGDESLRGVDPRPWYSETARTLRDKGYRVLFRPHPMSKISHTVPGVDTIGGTLATALEGAAVTVCYSSNTAVESVLAGVPACTVDPGAMAFPVTTRLPLDPPHMPERRVWAAELAWKQYSKAEIKSGFAWAIARRGASEFLD